MADFVAVLRKTISGLGDNTPEIRQQVYDKARSTISAKLAAISPPPSQIVIDRQKQALENAISVVEAEFEPAALVEDADDLDDFLASISAPPREPAADTVFPQHPEPTPVDEPEAVAEPAPHWHQVPEDAPAPEPAFEAWQEERQPAAPEAEEAFAPSIGLPRAEPFETVDRRSHEVDPVLDGLPPAAGVQPDEELVPVAAQARPEPVLAGTAAASGRNARPRRRYSGLIAAALALLVIGGASYGIWLNRAEFASLLGLEGRQVAESEQPAEVAEPADGAEDSEIVALPPEAPDQSEQSAMPAPPQQEAVEKFTQRLTPEGEEVDAGPAGGTPGVGEGTSVANLSAEAQEALEEGEAAADDGAPAQAGVQVGQSAIYYEERTSVSDGTAERGSTVWSVIQESPGANEPPEPAIRAEVSIPARDLQLRLTIRRNADASLPASHIVEMIFLTPENFTGGSINNVLRIAFKPNEEAPGTPLLGIPAKIADDYFLVALSDQQADTRTNVELLRTQDWIDIPIVYGSGRRALVTMEKGIPGGRVFDEVIQAWQDATSG